MRTSYINIYLYRGAVKSKRVIIFEWNKTYIMSKTRAKFIKFN